MNDSQRQQVGMDPPQGNESHTNRCNDDTPKDLSIKTKKLKQIPPPLNLMTKQHDTINMLKDSAVIATSPKSPLMQKNLPFRKRAYSFSGVNDAAAKPVLPPTPTTVTDSGGSNHEVPPSPSCLPASSQSSPGILHPPSPSLRVLQPPDPIHRPMPMLPALPPHTLGILDSSALLSPAPSSLGSSQEELNYSPGWTSTGLALPWPRPAWHCFLPGTRVRIDQLHGGCWQLVDDLITSPSAWSAEWLAPLQLDIVHLIRNTEEIDPPSPTLSLQFTYATLPPIPPIRLARPWEGRVTAECDPHHPFYVQDKGWSAVYPELVLKMYGVVCKRLERGDVCISATSLPIMSPDICERFKSFSFPPEETPLHSSTSMPPPPPSPLMPPPDGLLSPPSSPNKKALDALRPKRPMNAFMLFAKKYRLELIQRYPGKDNRAISVLLGEAWRSLPPPDREVYVQEAKIMAQEQKRLHPDCWKRKRSHSTSSLQQQI